MSQITFSKAVISHGTFKNDGGKVSRTVHVTANPTKPVREAMGWQELPDCADMAELKGLLTATNLVLSPNDEKLDKYEIECECTSVDAFEIHRVQDKDGGEKLELRFRLKITERAALAKIEAYCEKVGEAPAQLKIGYSDQDALPLEKGSEVVGAKKAAAGA